MQSSFIFTISNKKSTPKNDPEQSAAINKFRTRQKLNSNKKKPEIKPFE